MFIPSLSSLKINSHILSKFILLGLILMVISACSNNDSSSTETENQMVLSYLSNNIDQLALGPGNSVGSQAKLNKMARQFEMKDNAIPDSIDCVDFNLNPPKNPIADTIVSFYSQSGYKISSQLIAFDNLNRVLNFCEYLDAFRIENHLLIQEQGTDVITKVFKENFETSTPQYSRFYESIEFPQGLILYTDTLITDYEQESIDIEKLYFTFQDTLYNVNFEKSKPEWPSSTSSTWSSIRYDSSEIQVGWLEVLIGYKVQIWNIKGLLIEE